MAQKGLFNEITCFIRFLCGHESSTFLSDVGNLHCEHMKPQTSLLLCLCFIGWTPKPKTPSKDDSAKPKSTKTPKDKNKPKNDSPPPAKEANKDDSFREFRRLCAALSDTDSYTGKTAHVRDFFTKGTDGSEYRNPLLSYCTVSVIAVPNAASNLDPETSCLEPESVTL